MKKIFILLVVLVGTFTFSFAQNIKLFHSDNELGDTLVLDGIDPNTVADVELVIGVLNNTTDSMSVFVEKKYVSVLPNSYNSFCLDVCFAQSVFISPRPLALAPGELSDASKFHIVYNPSGNIGVSTIKYVFTPRGGEGADSVVVKFVSDGVGINDKPVSINNFTAFPNPAHNQVNVQYDISNYRSNQAQIVITNLIGSKVQSVPVYSAKGKATLDISNLGTGIYFYSLQIDNKIVATKKLVVK